MANPFVGEIRMFAFSFPPKDWAICDGSLMLILQNEPLFNLLGTTYGGDGLTTFALPDLRSRVPVSQGQGTGLSDRVLGEAGGAETVTLTTAQMPNHTHPLVANSTSGTSKNPGGNVLAKSGPPIYAPQPDETEMNQAAIGPTGSSQPFGILPPSLTLNFCISLFGIYPSQT